MKVCISCQENVDGKRAVPVKEDRVIRTIRAIKKKLGIAQMNELYVSEKCLPEHVKRRRSFEKSLLFASVIAGLILVVVIVALLLSGRFNLWAIVSAFIIGGFVLLLPLFKYAPAVESTVPRIVGAPAPAVAPPLKKEAAKPPPAKKKPRKKAKQKKKR